MKQLGDEPSIWGSGVMIGCLNCIGCIDGWERYIGVYMVIRNILIAVLRVLLARV